MLKRKLPRMPYLTTRSYLLRVYVFKRAEKAPTPTPLYSVVGIRIVDHTCRPEYYGSPVCL